MARMIFVNLPVADVARSTAFYQAIGFEKNEQFSGAQAASLRWSDTITIGVMDRALYATFTPKQIIDAHVTSGALFALGVDSRAEVDAISAAAVAAGGRELHGPEDEGFMYSRGFEDPDGHGFGPMFMDMAAFAAATPAAA